MTQEQDRLIADRLVRLVGLAQEIAASRFPSRPHAALMAALARDDHIVQAAAAREPWPWRLPATSQATLSAAIEAFLQGPDGCTR